MKAYSRNPWLVENIDDFNFLCCPECAYKSKDEDAFTGKSFSEALILASTNPQYDKRLFIDLQVHYMKTTSSEHVVYTNCCFVFVLTFRRICVHNMY